MQLTISLNTSEGYDSTDISTLESSLYVEFDCASPAGLLQSHDDQLDNTIDVFIYINAYSLGDRVYCSTSHPQIIDH